MRTHYKGLYFEQDKYLMSISPVRLLWNAGATFYNYERFFTVEAWIRFDTNTAKQMAKGKLAYVYQIVTTNNINSTVLKLGLIVSNSFFRVQIGSYHMVDVDENFLDPAKIQEWRFIAATFKKSDDFQLTDVDMYIDNVRRLKDYTLHTTFNSLATDYSVIGHHFPGQIMLIRMHNNWNTFND